MGISRQNPGVSRLGRFVRGRQPDRNSLRRPSDRAETAILMLLVLAFIAAAPCAALAVGAWTQATMHQEQVSQQASWRQVPTRVLSVSSGTQGGGYGAFSSQAQARWTAPDGKVVTGEIPVPFGTAAGTVLRLWTDKDGHPTGGPPLRDSQVSESVYVAAAFGVVVLGGLLTIAGVLARMALDRRRMDAWDADWRATAPRWTTRA